MKLRNLLWIILGVLLFVGCSFFSIWILRVIEKNALTDLERNMGATGKAVADLFSGILAKEKISREEIDEIQQRISQIQISSGSRLRIFSRDRTLLADSFGLPEGQEHLKLRPEITLAFQGKYGAYTRFADETEKSLALFVALPVEYQGKVVGAVYISHNTDEILQRLGSLRHMVRSDMLILAFLTFLANILLSSNLNVTIQKIRDLSRKMSGGSLEEKVSITGKGEIAEIADSFNRMADSLKAKIKELEEEKEKTKKFIQDISHELKTPLTGLSGTAEALAAGAWEDRESCARFVCNIQRDTQRLSRLVSHLLDLQKLEYDQIKEEKCELVSLLEKLSSEYEMEASRKKVTLNLVTPPEAFVRGDPEKILKVVENLLENALRFSPEGGEIEMRILDADDHLRVEISDQGPGVPPEEEEKIFQRFHRGARSDSHSGTAGLGLSIAKEIMARHGETIGVTSHPGRGSQFYFTLKRCD